MKSIVPGEKCTVSFSGVYYLSIDCAWLVILDNVERDFTIDPISRNNNVTWVRFSLFASQ